MDKDYLILKRASASRPSGEWNDDDFDVLADGAVVGRIFKVHAAPEGTPWIWTLAFGHHEDRTPTHGYAATGEAAMTAFAKSWRREQKKAPSSRDGYTEAILQAHGFSTEQMVHLVQAGLATAHSQRVLAGRRVIQMPRYLLTFRFTADSLPRLLSTSY